VQHLPKAIDEAGNRNHFHENHWKRVGMDLLKRHLGDGDGLTLLDYGCGRGETLRLAKGSGMHAQGTDLDPECVAISRTHGESVLLTSPQDPVAQFGGKSFDVVTCFHVLEHVDRPKEVLASLGRIARRWVVLAVPNLRALPRPRFLRHEPNSVNEGHLQGWDHAHLRNLAERHCGLHIEAWAHDHCRVPVIGDLVSRIAGDRFLVSLETGLFVRLFPFHSASLIALMTPVADSPAP
jgi:ubiquinone/menaquinone biosynthesis C-methylase UbiE